MTTDVLYSRPTISTSFSNTDEITEWIGEALLELRSFAFDNFDGSLLPLISEFNQKLTNHSWVSTISNDEAFTAWAQEVADRIDDYEGEESENAANIHDALFDIKSVTEAFFELCGDYDEPMVLSTKSFTTIVADTGEVMNAYVQEMAYDNGMIQKNSPIDMDKYINWDKFAEDHFELYKTLEFTVDGSTHSYRYQ